MWISLPYRHKLIRDADVICTNCSGYGIDIAQPDDACRCAYGREWKWGHNRQVSDKQLRTLMIAIRATLHDNPELVLSVFQICRMYDELFPVRRRN
jgi:hypothetical protein